MEFLPFGLVILVSCVVFVVVVWCWCFRCWPCRRKSQPVLISSTLQYQRANWPAPTTTRPTVATASTATTAGFSNQAHFRTEGGYLGNRAAVTPSASSGSSQPRPSNGQDYAAAVVGNGRVPLGQRSSNHLQAPLAAVAGNQVRPFDKWADVNAGDSTRQPPTYGSTASAATSRQPLGTSRTSSGTTATTDDVIRAATQRLTALSNPSERTPLVPKPPPSSRNILSVPDQSRTSLPETRSRPAGPLPNPGIQASSQQAKQNMFGMTHVDPSAPGGRTVPEKMIIGTI